ncbi:MAG: hypothetical protein J3K34DRAFT_210081 [Monoraphidium minutum]|nr:MAG: hypothetical protein J3K34DRAFT_210081 [Monoraphidium minutum]
MFPCQPRGLRHSPGSNHHECLALPCQPLPFPDPGNLPCLLPWKRPISQTRPLLVCSHAAFGHNPIHGCSSVPGISQPCFTRPLTCLRPLPLGTPPPLSFAPPTLCFHNGGTGTFHERKRCAGGAHCMCPARSSRRGLWVHRSPHLYVAHTANAHLPVPGSPCPRACLPPFLEAPLTPRNLALLSPFGVTLGAFEAIWKARHVCLSADSATGECWPPSAARAGTDGGTHAARRPSLPLLT